MLTRRGFTSCALCAVTGFAATAAETQQPAATPGVKRTILQQIDGPVDGYVTIIVMAEIEAGAQVARHTHPGIESTFIIEGSSELSVDGQAARMVKAGEGLQVPANTPHSVKNGDAKTRLVANYIVEKGKPLASPA
jgi:quercetin dioxygenase-like cupin family protein